VGLTEITLSFEIDSQADAKKLEKLVQLTERCCVIYQTLSHLTWPKKMGTFVKRKRG
jgi:uncharacterized OsmC-like protein